MTQPPTNNIFVGNADPLLGPPNNLITQQYQNEYAQRMQQLESAKQQLMQQAPMPIPVSKSPVWDSIDKEVDAMTSSEQAYLNDNPEYRQSAENIQNILQGEFLKIMRPIVENSPAGREALDKHLTILRRVRKDAAEQSARSMELFKEYTEKYSDMPYSEFIKMKQNKKK
jgi:hypothetical protein